jgi:opacity protein-like surface antigen
MAFSSLRAFVVTLTVVAGCLIPASNARAAEREEMTDFFLFGQFSGDDDTTVSMFGVEADITYEDALGIGFGVGRNVNPYINLNGTLLVAEAELTATVGPFSESVDGTLVAPDFNVDWNIMDADVTPFVTAGAGVMFFFGDESDTEFSYGAGAGVRWDISHDTFMKVWYRARWFEVDDVDDTFLLHTFNVGFGIMR